MEPAAKADELAAYVLRIDAIAGQVEQLVNSIVNLREELEATGTVLPGMASYRLASILSRVDHAAAEIVIQQSRRIELLDGQLKAFDDAS